MIYHERRRFARPSARFIPEEIAAGTRLFPLAPRLSPYHQAGQQKNIREDLQTLEDMSCDGRYEHGATPAAQRISIPFDDIDGMRTYRMPVAIQADSQYAGDGKDAQARSPWT